MRIIWHLKSIFSIVKEINFITLTGWFKISLQQMDDTITRDYKPSRGKSRNTIFKEYINLKLVTKLQAERSLKKKNEVKVTKINCNWNLEWNFLLWTVYTINTIKQFKSVFFFNRFKECHVSKKRLAADEWGPSHELHISQLNWC